MTMTMNSSMRQVCPFRYSRSPTVESSVRALYDKTLLTERQECNTCSFGPLVFLPNFRKELVCKFQSPLLRYGLKGKCQDTEVSDPRTLARTPSDVRLLFLCDSFACALCGTSSRMDIRLLNFDTFVPELE